MTALEGGRRSADFDLRAATFTFDALEKAIIQSVAADEFEAAAGYLDVLFYLADQLEEYHEEHRSEAKRLAVDDAGIGREEEALQIAIRQVQHWAAENDHPAREWFNGGVGA